MEFVETGRQAEVGQLYVAASVEENVVGFDITTDPLSVYGKLSR